MKILLAFDGSPSSHAAAAAVCERPWPANSEVRIVTVLPYLSSGHDGVSRFPTTSACEYLMKQQSDEAARAQAVLAAEFSQSRLSVSCVMLEGRPEEAVVEEAERWGADLIVLGCHGFGRVGRFVLGSVSFAVASNAPCSVEIVRQGQDKEPSR